MVQSIFVEKEIIDYTDYLLPKPIQVDIIEIDILKSFDDTLLTYKDAIPIDESAYFWEEQKILVEGYNSHRNDLIDTEESRQSYFLKSRRHSEATFLKK
ncbi:MAG: hypothetical protein ACC656_01685 [Candidatus Heimdallarchaeota archaeon]